MKQRMTRKGRADTYTEARSALLGRACVPGASEFMWLEVVEGQQPESIDFVIHADRDVRNVPPFAIEVYRHGELQSFEPARTVIHSHALMPEDLRCRIVAAQRAASLIGRVMGEAAQATAVS